MCVMITCTNTPFKLGLLCLTRDICFTVAAINMMSGDACEKDGSDAVIELTRCPAEGRHRSVRPPASAFGGDCNWESLGGLLAESNNRGILNLKLKVSAL